MNKTLKRILVVNHSCNPGGATVSLRNLLRMTTMKYPWVKFDIVHLDSGPRVEEFHQYCDDSSYAAPKSKFERLANRVINVAYGRHTSRQKLQDSTMRNIRRGYYDCILVNTIVPLTMVQDWLPSNVPIYCWVHELDKYCYQLFGADHIRLLSLPITYVACSDAVDVFLTRINPCRVSTILSECIELEYFENHLRTPLNPTSALSVGMIGTVDIRKGYDLFIAVAGRVKRSGYPIRFTWVGCNSGTSVDDFVRKIDESGLRSYVELIPYQQSSLEILRSLDVLLLTSREDPNPLVIIEALASGVVPIVQNGTGGAVLHAELCGGFIVDYESVDDMETTILSFMNGFGDLHTRSLKASTYAFEQLHPETVAQRFVELVLV
jgi:glycosyltransferase involved in cell wall biosynthesis